jgi:hypothetical protein
VCEVSKHWKRFRSKSLVTHGGKWERICFGQILCTKIIFKYCYKWKLTVHQNYYEMIRWLPFDILFMPVYKYYLSLNDIGKRNVRAAMYSWLLCDSCENSVLPITAYSARLLRQNKTVYKEVYNHHSYHSCCRSITWVS